MQQRGALSARHYFTTMAHMDDHLDQLLTIAEAAKLTGVAKSTITRARTRGEFPRAQQRQDTWYIPIGDLINSGRLDTIRQNPPEEPTSATSTQDHQNLVHALELEKQRAHYAEQQLHQAQQLIQAKQDTIDALKTTIHALETTQQKQLTDTPHQENPHPRPEAEHKNPPIERRSPLQRLSQWIKK